LSNCDRLSDSFTLDEFLRSDTAARHPETKAQQYDPPAEVRFNLNRLVAMTLQPIRSALGCPISVLSGYRSPEVNRLVGGVPSSQHVKGEAADVRLSGRFTDDAAFTARKRALDDEIANLIGFRPQRGVNSTYYLFAYVCMHLDELEVDQVIHEHGAAGRPAWIHISNSANSANGRRRILAIGGWTGGHYRKLSRSQALRLGR